MFRSLGDLKYKQLKHLQPEDQVSPFYSLTSSHDDFFSQIITAEPDISIFDIHEEDEFFILACDGIWDCLTNQQAVSFLLTNIVSILILFSGF